MADLNASSLFNWHSRRVRIPIRLVSQGGNGNKVHYPCNKQTKFSNIFSVPCGSSPQMVALMADLNASSVFNGHSRRVRIVARGLVSE